LVFAGGGAGALLRWLLTRWAGAPWGTALVNVLGCFAMGLLAGWLAGRAGAEPWRLLLATGLLGGFTTFSAFALDSALLWRGGASGQAVLYLAVSVGGSLLAVIAGLLLTR
jgi:fluoride exporter